jgi:hypothetical protein
LRRIRSCGYRNQRVHLVEEILGVEQVAQRLVILYRVVVELGVPQLFAHRFASPSRFVPSSPRRPSSIAYRESSAAVPICRAAVDTWRLA